MSRLDAGKGFGQIKALFQVDEHVETDTEYLLISNDCLIYPLKKNDIPAGTDLNKAFEQLKERVYNDQKQLFILLYKQPKLQLKLLDLFSNLKNRQNETQSIHN